MKGVSFRDAYVQVGQSIENQNPIEIYNILTKEASEIFATKKFCKNSMSFRKFRVIFDFNDKRKALEQTKALFL